MASLNFSRLLWSLTPERDDVSLGSERPEETAEIQATIWLGCVFIKSKSHGTYGRKSSFHCVMSATFTYYSEVLFLSDKILRH